jgi:hypothetical protein
MRYQVYADLSRRLTEEERSAVFEALEINVPDSGCVGPQNREEDEVYFSVEAPSDDKASALAAHYMNIVISHAGLDVQYMLALQTIDGGFRAWTPET